MNSRTEARVPELDGLRGIAIALVLWWHLVEPCLPLGRSHWLGWVRAGSNLSWSGVDLFFILSGYFIGGILIDRRESPHLAKVFYVRRALRILPLYYVTLAVCAGVAAIGWITPSFPLWVYATFVANFAFAWVNSWDALQFSILWSLAVEEQFYLAAPWVVRWVRRERLPWLLAGLIVLAWILRVTALQFSPDAWTARHVLTPFRMDLLAGGALIAWGVRSERCRPFFAALGRHWRVWLGAAALLYLALSATMAGLGSALMVYLGYSVLLLCYGLLVAIVAGARPPALIRLLSVRPLVSLGRHSYFLYLWHALIGTGTIVWLGGPELLLDSVRPLLIVLAGIGATWAAAIVSGKFFEAPLITLGHRFRY